ncbi:MAG TPA: NDP-sugar synthase [Acidimicrobiales bacterium]|nr:NDP-sugar synthase [Acidimicrobiales bacterium]
MRAVVLVGGFGTRLRPLTNTRPKQMLPIVNRPMIEHVVGHLADHGIDDVVLSMGYRPDAFAAAYPSGRCAGATLHYAVEPEPLDTAGAIRFAAEDAGIDSRFLVLNGDILTDLDLTAFLAFHESHGAEGTIHLFPVDDPSRFGVVPTDDDGRVLAFVEKPPRDEAPTNLINAGTYVLEPSVLDRIPAGRKVSVERETFPAMAAAGTLYAVGGATYWLDTGTPEQYLQAQVDLLEGVRGTPVDGVDPTAEVSPDATVVRSVIGPGATVDAGATVMRSVLLRGAWVHAGSIVVDSVLGESAEVLPGARIVGGTVVGDGEVIESGTSLDGARVPVAAP